MTIAWIALLCEGIITFIIKVIINDTGSSMKEFSIPIIIFHSIITILSIYSSKIDNKIKKIIILSFIFRLLLMIWDNIGRNIFPFPDSPDTYTFKSTASRIYNQIGGGRGGIYPKFLAYIVYGFFGEQPLVAQYLNVIISISTILITYKSMLILNIKTKIIYCTILIMCFLPYLAIDDSLLLREAPIQILLTISVYLFFKWLNSKQTIFLIFAFIFTLIASSLHSGSIAMILAFIIWILLYDHNKKIIKLTTRSISISLLIIGVFFLIYKFSENEFSKKFDNTDSISDDIVQVASAHAAGGSAYSIGTTSNSISALIAYTPLRMLYFFASPVPWMWRGVSDIISFIFSSSFYLYTIFMAIRIIIKKNSIRQTFIILLSISIFIGAAVFAWGVSNAGAALRHRDKFIVVIVILYALCKEVQYERMNNVKFIKVS